MGPNSGGGRAELRVAVLKMDMEGIQLQIPLMISVIVV